MPHFFGPHWGMGYRNALFCIVRASGLRANLSLSLCGFSIGWIVARSAALEVVMSWPVGARTLLLEAILCRAICT